MSDGMTLDDLRKHFVFGTTLDFAGRRKCEMCGRWNGPPHAHVPGSGWFCLYCETFIQRAQKDASDPELQRLAEAYNQRRADRAKAAA